MTGTLRRLAGDESGSLRGILVVLLVIVVVAVVGVDLISVYSSAGQLREDAQAAAERSKAVFVDTGRDDQAQSAARNYLSSRDATLLQFSATRASGTVTYVVKASSDAHTYLLKYLTHLPWGAGNWIERKLRHTVTEQSQ